MTRITILDASYNQEVLAVEGKSGKPYRFKWCKENDQYEYQPKTKEESDDIYGVVQFNSYHIFAPVCDLVSDLELNAVRNLKEQCVAAGLKVLEGDNSRTLYRVLAAYNHGRNPDSAGAPASVAPPKAPARPEADFTAVETPPAPKKIMRRPPPATLTPAMA